MWIDHLRAGQPVCGTMLRLVRQPAVIPLVKAAGFDFCMVDMEHGDMGLERLADMAIAARACGLGLLVRVPELARGYVSRALDCGAQGIMVPMVESAEQATLLARWGKYPPLGGRGLSSVGGNTDYRRITDFAAAMAAANRDTLTIAQVETVPAIAAAEAIAATPGIDALLVGPNDLAVALGHPNDMLREDETAAIATFARAARAHGKIFGIHAPADFLRPWVSHGLTLAMSNIDLNILAAGLAGVERDTRQLFPPAARG